MNEAAEPTGTSGAWTPELMAAHKARIEFMEAMGQAHYSRTDAQWHVARFAKMVGVELEAENAKLRAKLAQLERFTECFVAHPYEGTLECDVAKPCPFCRYQHMVLQESCLRDAVEVLTQQLDAAYTDRDLHERHAKEGWDLANERTRQWKAAELQIDELKTKLKDSEGDHRQIHGLQLQIDRWRKALEHVVECKSPDRECEKGWAKYALEYPLHGAYERPAEKRNAGPQKKECRHIAQTCECYEQE